MFTRHLPPRALQSISKNTRVIRVTHAKISTKACQGSLSPTTLRIQQSNARYQTKQPLTTAVAVNPENQLLVDCLTERANEDFVKGLLPSQKLRGYGNHIAKIASIKGHVTSAVQLFDLYVPQSVHTTKYVLGAALELTKEGKLPLDVNETHLVYGLTLMPTFGRQKMRQVIAAGLKSLTDVTKPEFRKFFSSTQLVGLKYGGQIESPVSVEAANAFLEFCKRHTDPTCQWYLAGDHRRGVESNQIILLVSHPSYSEIRPPPQLSEIPLNHFTTYPLSNFESFSYLKHMRHTFNALQSIVMPALTSAELLGESTKRGYRTWEGAAVLPGLTEKEWKDSKSRITALKNAEGNFCHLKLKIVPEKALGAALIHCTGDFKFLKHLKQLVLKENLYLNDDGLWRWTPTESTSEQNSAAGTEAESSEGYWKNLEAHTEEAIFEALGIPFVKPESRGYNHWKPWGDQERSIKLYSDFLKNAKSQPKPSD